MNRGNEALRLHLALLFVQATFGAFHVVGKFVLREVEPLAVASVRVLVSTPLLFFLALRKDRRLPTRRDLVGLALLGFLGVFANQLLYITGLGMTSATNAAILMPSIPVFVALLLLVSGKERPTPLRWGGIALACAGALTLLDWSGAQFGRGALLGNLLLLVNCLAYAIYLVLQRGLLERLHPLTVVAWAFLLGGVGVIAAGTPALARSSPSSLAPGVLAGLLFIAIVPTGVNYALNAWALTRSSPALVAAYTTLQPAAAAALAATFLGERLGWREGAGFALVTAGLLLVSRRAGELGDKMNGSLEIFPSKWRFFTMRNGNEGLTIEAYHRRTQHRYGRFAAGPRYLDWSCQPFPFRIWAGSPATTLPFETSPLPVSFHTLHLAGAIPPREVHRESLGLFWSLAMGLTAAKELTGTRWALRANPSSGNLHPIEGYLVWPGGGGVAAGVHHYRSRDHLLEGRALLPPEAVWPWKGFFVALSSVAWRTSWKYGERAFRYVFLDAGHALASLRYAAAVLGWTLQVDGRWGDAEGEALLGLLREADFRVAEREGLEMLAWVSPVRSEPPSPREVLSAFREARWKGQANRLSGAQIPWQVVEWARAAARIPAGGPWEPAFRPSEGLPALKVPSRNRRAVEVLRDRRSGVAYDGKTPMAREVFFRMADALLPRPGVPPFDALPWPARVHALFFLHRVENLQPGLYLLPRRLGALEELRRVLDGGFLFEEVEGAPTHLGLLRLKGGDLRDEARFLSCNQEIASQSAFAVSLAAEFAPVLKNRPWVYRHLHYEAGAVGHALYLWAEAEGFRGTGIGCFFDDEVHRRLGLGGNDLQVLYHFTVGTPMEDRRLVTLPPYGHLPPERRP